jgi:hypothetical protein
MVDNNNGEALRLVDDISTIIERAINADLKITSHLLKMARLDLLLNINGISSDELKTFSAIVDNNLEEGDQSH